jgi:hypothetical protein
MGQLFYGSICLTDLIENAKKKHSAFTKGNNGKLYAAVNVWLNDNVDKFGNIMSVQINPSKAMKDLEDRIYIGNLKQSDGPTPISDRDVSGLDTNLDVPEKKTAPSASAADITEPIEDLPF